MNTDEDFLLQISQNTSYDITATDGSQYYVYLDLVDEYGFKMPAFENMLGLTYNDDGDISYQLFMMGDGYPEIKDPYFRS